MVALPSVRRVLARTAQNEPLVTETAAESAVEAGDDDAGDDDAADLDELDAVVEDLGEDDFYADALEDV